MSVAAMVLRAGGGSRHKTEEAGREQRRDSVTNQRPVLSLSANQRLSDQEGDHNT